MGLDDGLEHTQSWAFSLVLCETASRDTQNPPADTREEEKICQRLTDWKKSSGDNGVDANDTEREISSKDNTTFLHSKPPQILFQTTSLRR